MYGKGLDINGIHINNAVGYCHYKEHAGYLNKEICKEKQCVLKHCVHLEMFNEKCFRSKEKFYNKSGKNKRAKQKHRNVSKKC